MSRGRIVFLLISVAVLSMVISGSLSRAANDSEAEDSLTKQLSVFSEVLHLIRRAYVEETEIDQLLNGALAGTTDALDPLSTYVPADQVEAYEKVRQLGPHRSGLTVLKERGIAYVVAAESGSPGGEIGIERGDILARVRGRPTRPMPLWELQSILAEEPGTEIELETLRRGQTEQKTLTLRNYEERPPTLDDRRGVPILRIPRFEETTAGEVRSILEELHEKGHKKLVVDLRGVAGGDSSTAYAIAGFLVSGHLGELAVRGGEKVSFESMEPPVWSGEAVVLIDSGCQGPAEILASVLRQKADSQLVGERTFGLAGRQALLPLSDGSRLLLTNAFYTGPDGEPIDEGLSPDLVVSASVRGFSDRDVSLDDLILERGLDLLLDEDEAPAREVA